MHGACIFKFDGLHFLLASYIHIDEVPSLPSPHLKISSDPLRAYVNGDSNPLVSPRHFKTRCISCWTLEYMICFALVSACCLAPNREHGQRMSVVGHIDSGVAPGVRGCLTFFICSVKRLRLSTRMKCG